MPKFRTTASVYKVKFKDVEVTDDVLSALKVLFSSLFDEMTKGSKSNDLVMMTIQSPSLDYPIVIPMDKLSTLTTDRFMAELERVLQSNEEFVIDESLIFEVTLVDMPEGGTGKRFKHLNTEKFLKDKKCIIRIQNNDELCCARAIITAKAQLDKHQKWESIRKCYEPQGQLAKQLHSEASVPLKECGVEEIKQFQEVLPGYQINVVSKEHFHGIIYSSLESDKKIYLFYHDNHNDVITSMTAFLSRNYYCTNAKKDIIIKKTIDVTINVTLAVKFTIKVRMDG